MTEHENKPNLICLNDGWTLCHHEKGINFTVNAPFDVHSALIDSGTISDPYWRDRELELDWIHASEWVLSRKFSHSISGGKSHCALIFDCIDCMTTVCLNGAVVGQTSSQFLQHRFLISNNLKDGENHLEITFHSNSKFAAEAAKLFPFELPYVDWNCRIGHLNHLRKTQCHAGWDWNIALMPLGIYRDVHLHHTMSSRLDDIKVVQRHSNEQVTVEVMAFVHGYSIADADFEVSFCGCLHTTKVAVIPGENQFCTTLRLDNPELWWPVGQGAQILHTLTVRVNDDTVTRRVGLRETTLLTNPDEYGDSFTIAINGRKIFMRGANWIPADALPAQATQSTVESLLLSAVDANFNMIRIWGGGNYEADWFYDLCDQLGLLVWQDFMFSCNHYPAINGDWLALVRREARHQIRRLSSHACLALWCGDNELVGALNWFDVTRNNRDRYLANYAVLNHALEEAFNAECVDVPFWPSSPSSGRMNFGDGWHNDRSGDMHFWDVWHSAKSFEHYRTVRPRFCSEFGFQSFPSMRCIERFTEVEDRNVSSPIMDVHQRNEGGNSRIIETISRYFRFPDSFERIVFLSQVSQALAMQTAIEFWRSNKPRTMGTLYWQLNDTWPVASWSSIEHGGAWKLCHYLARRFYAPVMVSVQPDSQTGEIVLVAIADCPGGVSLTVDVSEEQLQGGRRTVGTESIDVPDDRAIEFARLAPDTISDQAFLHVQWCDVKEEHVGETTFFENRYKTYDLPKAKVQAHWAHGAQGASLELSTDKPAFYVTAGLGESMIYSDNGIMLLPDRPKTIRALYDCQNRDMPLPEHLDLPILQHLAD